MLRPDPRSGLNLGPQTAQAGADEAVRGTPQVWPPNAALPTPVDDTPWWRWRDQLLANPRFRRFAAGFWPTRWIARRRAAALFDLVGGFVYSQVLLACVRLQLFEILAQGPLSTAEIARRTDLPVENAECLLQAASALRLVQAHGASPPVPDAEHAHLAHHAQHWRLGNLGAVLVGDQAISAMVAHHEALYADLADPVRLLRRAGPAHGGQAAGGADSPGGALAKFWPYAGHAPGAAALQDSDVGPYSTLMATSQPLVAEQVLDAVRLTGHRCLLDVGGGEGAFVAAVAAHAPHLALQLFDLPAVAARARHSLASRGLTGRVQVHGGSFLHDPLPRGADVITLVRVVHDHDDQAVRALLAAVLEALPPGGRLLLAEPMAQTPGAAAMGQAYFGFYLLAMGQGQARTAARLGAMLQASGFESVRQIRTRQPLQTSLLEARKPLAGAA